MARQQHTASGDDADDEILLRMGYATQLKRGLGKIGSFASGFSEVAILASMTSLYGQGLHTGGPSASVWGFLLVFFFSAVVAMSMAEICSAFPSAGSVYHWAAQLVPEKYSPLASFVTGWSNWIGNLSGNAAFAYSFAIFLKAGLQSSGIQPFDDSSAVIIALGTNAVWTLINWIDIHSLTLFNSLSAAFHTASLLIIIIALLASSSRLQSAQWVFLEYSDSTGLTDDKLSQKSYVFTMGILVSAYYFSGYEASAHLSEETHGAAENAPAGIINTVTATGLGGIAYLLALLFSTSDIDQVMATDDAVSTLTGCAAVNVFIVACGWGVGSMLTWLVVANLFCAGISCVAVTGRITFALARDQAFPYSDYLMQVHPIMHSPIRSINFVSGIVSLLLLLTANPESANAFYSIVSLCTVGFEVSYGIPILCKLLFHQVPFPPSRYALGRWSFACGVVSCVWLFGSSLLFFFPSSGPLTLKTTNWLAVVVAGCVAFAWGYWACGGGRRRFRGPRRAPGPGFTPAHVPDADSSVAKFDEEGGVDVINVLHAMNASSSSSSPHQPGSVDQYHNGENEDSKEEEMVIESL